jgi:hypothetical protein
MQPTISREAVMFERRQPAFRWSAVLAGAVCSVGLWMLLQILGTGIGLAAIDVDDAGSLRGVGIGTTVWSLLAPLIAMFCGGLLTGRLTQTYERKLGGAHAVVMWAITSVIGLCVTIWIMTMLATTVANAGGVPRVTPRQDALDAADATGKVLATVGLSLLLSLIAAVAGAMVAMRRPLRSDGGGGARRVTEPGYVPPDEPIRTTAPAPYPPATPRDLPPP